MDKKYKSLLQFIKKTSITGLTLLLTWTLYQLTKHYQDTQLIKLPTSDAPVEIYSNQTRDNLLRLFQNAINQAKESIVLVIYSLTDSQIIQALQKKSEEGVEIYIVCDAKASPDISYRLPRSTLIKRVGQGLMHQKILIIDRKQILLGSANMTTSSLNVHDNLVIGVEHPMLAQALIQRAKSMKEDGSYSPLLHLQTTAGPQNLELWLLPDDPYAAKRMTKLLRSAQKSIKIAMFTWTRLDFTEEIIAAAKRGVKVEAVIDRYSGKGASAKIVRLLEKTGIPIQLSTGNKLLHHKFVYIDNTTLVNGSANWTQAAFKDNDDDFMVIYPLTLEQQTKMNQIWKAIINESEKPTISNKKD